MSRKLLMVGIASAFAVTACVSTMKNANRMAASDAGGNSYASPLSVEQILADSSSGKLGLSNARLIIDNDEAFNSKMAIIKKAKNNLYLTYFIYANDYSSSLFNAALIEKARAGTKIKLLVDLTTNYSRMDLFRMLEAMGGGNIEVRFYNKPSKGVQKIALMATVACSTENQRSADKSACDNEKKVKAAAIEQAAAAGNADAIRAIGLSRLFLAGYYAKSRSAVQVAAVGGQNLDLAYAKNLFDQDKANKANFIGLAKAAKKYKISGSIFDGIAASNFNKALGDLTGETQNFITGLLPINEIMQDRKLKDDFDHWTDYTHQKLILGDVDGGGYIFTTGGRNIEDSYHLKTTYLKDLKGTQKYLFKDTEFYGEVTSGGDKIAEAFMKNWNFKDMVATSSEMNELAPFDFQLALQDCKADSPDFKTCAMQVIGTATQHPEVLAKRAQDRVKAEVANMQKKAGEFSAKYMAPSQKLAATSKFSFRGNGQSDVISANDLKTSTITFIENLHFSKDSSPQVRTYGTRSGYEARDGRYISDLWLKGLENACTLNKPTQVILHSAYLMPASNMIRTLGKMLDGTWDCGQVQLKIITNSFETTDLNVINILAQSEMQAIFQRNASSSSPRKATLSYYEYTRPQGQGESLHTKLSVLGDDMIVGSANADVRSYYMDSNTGVYIHNAPELVADYGRYIDGLMQDGTIINKNSAFGSVVNGRMVFADHEKAVANLTDAVVNYWIGRSSEAKKNSIEKAQIKYAKDKHYAMEFTNDLTKEIFMATNAIMSPPRLDDVKIDRSDVEKCVANGMKDHDYLNQVRRSVRDMDGYSSTSENQLVKEAMTDSCDHFVRQGELNSIDPDFNLKYEMF